MQSNLTNLKQTTFFPFPQQLFLCPAFTSVSDSFSSKTAPVWCRVTERTGTLDWYVYLFSENSIPKTSKSDFGSTLKFQKCWVKRRILKKNSKFQPTPMPAGFIGYA